MIGRKALGKRSLPQPVRDLYVWANRNVGRLDPVERVLPNFVVAGTQRGGTTSLFIYLLAHDLVFGPRRAKGVHYFDTNFHRSASWYRSNFPQRMLIDRLAEKHGTAPAVGEGAPYYMYNPQIPGRIHDIIPGCRIIMVLREPLDRAISHHNHEVKRGFETLSLTEAFDAEPERLAGEWEHMAADATYVSSADIHHAYLRRGQYADQVERYVDVFGPGQVLVLDSGRLGAEPEATVREATDFLGLKPVEQASYPLYNQRDHDPVPAELRERYGHVFADSNERLARLVPGRLDWIDG
ncbi:MAG: sulfotransferase domain-containing protein [Acidimicrobiales bacterium]